MLIEKRSEIDRVPNEEKEVAWGSTINKERLIGLPLVADDNIGAVLIRRTKRERPFNMFDREVLSVIAEETVMAIKNFQLYESQQAIILGSIKSIGKLLERHQHLPSAYAPVYFKIVKCLAGKLSMTGTDIEC